MAPATHSGRPPHPRALAAVILLVPVAAALVLAAFAWPAARLAPRDLPLGLAGPEPATRAMEQRLARQGQAFALHRYPDEAAARSAIENRDLYGAIVASPAGLTVLTASAASPLVAQSLQQVASAGQATRPPDRIAQGSGTTGAPGAPGAAGSAGTAEGAGAVGSAGTAGAARGVRVVDVVPADPDDPRGVALSASVLPLVLAGVLSGLAVWRAGRPGLAQAGALVGASLLAGLAAIGIAQGWLGVIGGDWLVNAGVLALIVLAIGSAVAGLAALLGHAGLALAVLVMVLLGNPLSGVSSAPELLPAPTGVIGQLLPPGAGGNLLRSTAFFDGAGATPHLTVLVLWAALGLAALMAAAVRARRTTTAAAPTADPVAVH